MGFNDVLKRCLLPLAAEGGKCLFYITVVSGIFLIARNEKDGKITHKED